MSDHMIPMDCDGLAEQLSAYLEGDAAEAVRAAIEAHAAACADCGPLLADIAGIRAEAAALPALAPSRDLWSGIAARIGAPVVPLATSRPFAATRRSWVRPSLAAAALILVTAGVTHVLTRASIEEARPAAVTAAKPAPLKVAEVRQDVPSSASSASHSSASSALEAVAVAPAPTSKQHNHVAHAEPRLASSTPSSTNTNSPLRLARNAGSLSQGDPVYGQEITKLRQLVRERRSQLDPATIAVLEQSIAVIDSAIAQSRAALAKDPASGFLAGQLNHSLEKKVELLRTAALLPART